MNVSIIVIMERSPIVARRSSSIWRRKKRRKERSRNSHWRMWVCKLWKERRRKKRLLSDSLLSEMLRRIAHLKKKSQHLKKILLYQAKNIDRIVITQRRKRRRRRARVSESIVIIIIKLFVDISRYLWFLVLISFYLSFSCFHSVVYSLL